jgi:VRR-NUC domain
MKHRFEKYDFEVLLLEGSYVSDPKVRRAVIEDGNDRCSVEEYSSRCFRRLGYSALRVENDPIAGLFSVFMSPLIQDASDPRGRMFGVADRFAFDAGTRGKIIWTRLPEDFGKPVYGVRRAAAINDHLRTITGQSHQLRRLFDLWLGPSEDLRQYLWGHRIEQIQVARQLIDILPSGSILEMLRYLVEDYWARRSGWPDLLIFKENEFFFAEVKSEKDKLGKSQQRWLRDNQERLHFPFKLVEVRRIELEAAVAT